MSNRQDEDPHSRNAVEMEIRGSRRNSHHSGAGVAVAEGFEDDEEGSFHLSEVGSMADIVPLPDSDTTKLQEGSTADKREDAAVLSLRLGIVVLLSVCALGFSLGAYFYIRLENHSDFDDEYRSYARALREAFNRSTYLRAYTLDVVSAAYTAQFSQADPWPNVTLRDFRHRTHALHLMNNVCHFAFAPLVTLEKREAWEAYAATDGAFEQGTHLKFTGISPDGTQVIDTSIGNTETSWTVHDGIGTQVDGETIPASGEGPFLPLWQLSSPTDEVHAMKDLMLVEPFRVPLNILLKTKKPASSMVLFDPRKDVPTPESIVFYPVFDDFAERNVVGVVTLKFEWGSVFQDVLPHAGKIDVVLRNNIGQVFTFQVDGPKVEFIANPDDLIAGGDFHDLRYDDDETIFQEDMVTVVDHSHGGWHEDRRHLPMVDERITLNEDVPIIFEISTYPTEDFYSWYNNVLPVVFSIGIGLIFLFCILVFVGYDYLVRRRHFKVLKSAERSNAIVRSLFPAIVRDRVYRDTEKGVFAWRRRRRNDEDLLDATHQQSGSTNETSLTLVENPKGKSKLIPIMNDNQKLRLKTYLSDNPSTDNTLPEDYESEPIAELFNNTTVMFADISGFTAWSSEREPSQVFFLLETLYRAFDAVASKLGVFKVETIGDCYVAVAGLPDPNDHHAVIMTWFAYECVRKMKDLLKDLEVQLGPGTSDLALRIGLHSGPVIAGVLRGEKSRFQLFGDTMNTAARMESTGDKNLIHASDDTARLLSDAGKTGWITPREGVVYAKGKGEMQTYWLKPRRGSSRGTSSYHINDGASSCGSSTIDSKPKLSLITKSQMQQSYKSIADHSLPNAHVDAKRWGNLSLDEALVSKGSSSNHKKTMQKRSRLVDWNVDLLLSFLAKIVAYRNQNSTRALHRDQSITGEASDAGNTRILEEVTEIINLPEFDSSNAGNKEQVELGPAVRSQLYEYVTRIAKLYQEHPFHNLEHASHVTMSAVKLMKRIINPSHIEPVDNQEQDGEEQQEQPSQQQQQQPRRRRSLGDSGRSFNNSSDIETLQRNLHDVTFGISSDPLTQFCVVFSALIHDVDHRGVPNAQLVKENHVISQKFGEKSTAEQNSVFVAWEILMEPRYEKLRSCIYATEEERQRFRQLLVNAVMATDIMDKELQTVRKNRWRKAFTSEKNSDQLETRSQDRNRKATSVLEHVIQASDVAHTMQHWHIFRKWNERLFDEMLIAYKQGRTEVDPTPGWYEGQISFFDFYIIPLAEKLKECGVFGVAGDEYLSYARENRREWAAKGREETETMLVNFDLRYGLWLSINFPEDAHSDDRISKIDEEGELGDSGHLSK